MAVEENSLLIFLFLSMLCGMLGEDLSFPSGMEPTPPVLEAWNLNTGLAGKSQKKFLSHFIDSCEKTATPSATWHREVPPSRQ